MPWKFPINFIGALKEQHPPSRLEDIPQQACYPSQVSSSSSRPSTPSSSGVSELKRDSDQPHSPLYGKPSPAETAGEIACLKDKSMDELKKLLTDKGTYDRFFYSLEQVKIQNNVRDELQKEILQLARENLEKDPRLVELRNQCTIIRTTELASAQLKFKDLERQKEDILSSYSLLSLLQKLQDSMDKIEEESEVLHGQFLEKEIDLSNFLREYKKLRTVYHRRSLLHLAAQTSV